MTRHQVVETLQKHLPTLRRDYGVVQLSLFGSVARDEAGGQSDVDLLVDFGDAPTFKQYMGATLYLEDLLGCRVDLVTEGTLKPPIARSIERDRLEIDHAA
jgi:predicted nucleotidyltransferase